MRYSVGDILRYRFGNRVLKSPDQHYLIIVGTKIQHHDLNVSVSVSGYYNTVMLETGESVEWNVHLVDDNPRFTKVE